MEYPKPPFAEQQQDLPGSTGGMSPRPDHGEQDYKGSGRLQGKVALITGADSGIGRAVALAYAREGADVAISYLDEHKEADATKALVEDAGQKALVLAGDIQSADHCRSLIDNTVETLGQLGLARNKIFADRFLDSRDLLQAVEGRNR